MVLPQTRFKKYWWYFPSLISAILIIGIIAAIYVFTYVDRIDREFLIRRTNTIAKALDVDDILVLSGTEDDLNNLSYIILKEKLKNIAGVNEDVRFIYLAGRKGGQTYFMVDSEDPGSDGYSPPGQVYFEASADFLSMFDSKNPLIEGPLRDRWGIWISALSPILDQNNNLVAVVGMDIDANNHIRNLVIYSSIPLLISLFLIMLVYLGARTVKKEEELLELKSEFVSVASHELRSPLTGITWALGDFVANQVADLKKSQKDFLEKIAKKCGLLIETVNELLSISSLENASNKALFQNFDVKVLVGEAIKNLELSAESKKVKVTLTDNWPGKLVYSCDAEKLKRVFSNLISNAIKYSLQNAKVQIDYRRLRDKHQFTIIDKGIGIPKKEQPKVFQGFYRARNAQSVAEGTGLGLYYVKKVIELHKGKIWLDSQENEGTKFYIELKL